MTDDDGFIDAVPTDYLEPGRPRQLTSTACP